MGAISSDNFDDESTRHPDKWISSRLPGSVSIVTNYEDLVCIADMHHGGQLHTNPRTTPDYKSPRMGARFEQISPTSSIPFGGV